MWVSGVRMEGGNTPTSNTSFFFYFRRVRMLKRLRGWHWAVLLGASAIIAITVQSAFAGLINATDKGNGDAVLKVATVSADPTPTAANVNPFDTLAPTAVPGATATVATDTGNLLFIRFTAQSLCVGVPGSYCTAQIFDNGAPVNPQPTNTAGGIVGNITPPGVLIFDEPDGVLSPGAMRSLEGWISPDPGTHVITVQVAAAGGATHEQVSNWNLTVERAG
jgi:hypothetical protein